MWKDRVSDWRAMGSDAGACATYDGRILNVSQTEVQQGFLNPLKSFVASEVRSTAVRKTALLSICNATFLGGHNFINLCAYSS